MMQQQAPTHTTIMLKLTEMKAGWKMYIASSKMISVV
jgi:hypothetical protein